VKSSLSLVGQDVIANEIDHIQFAKSREGSPILAKAKLANGTNGHFLKPDLINVLQQQADEM